ncbi:YdiU family protein [Sphingopyxis sp. PAMC25046]|uniref:protein adenylyltransferase SelO n=1 Tax=Sphingopyxis sp. PAMC25046 TaxID=2565556 RepID=UPI00109D857E|nr:YdiU family protein [Sphingopyxis sp. PAMC25046]QCB54758.1 YdiU family protein [Sphingopyxis sp. PAMC25046]
MDFAFENSFHDSMEGFYAPAESVKPSAPKLLLFNHALAGRLGIDIGGASDDRLARIFSGEETPEGANPLALAYAGHQFGHFSPQLGDGRALLLGEIVAPDGARFDIQLKGSGPTAFSRNGDGKAAIGPVLREFLVSEAMAAMGVPTTRALAAVATGDRVQRERAHPGAVLTRVASSHIRVGTFQFFAAHFGAEHVAQLSDYSVRRHFPELAVADNPHLALLDRVAGLQCELIAHWLGVGFIHGVMNTDNVAISGETIDYGPCAFMDRFAVNTVFSSIDAHGRYAYGRQPQIMHWNMARFAEALLPAIHRVSPEDVEAAKAIVDAIPGRFRTSWHAKVRQKLGLNGEGGDDGELIDSLFDELETHSIDFTAFFRALAMLLRGDGAMLESLLPNANAMAPWIAAWWDRIAQDSAGPIDHADAMDAVNPLYIPRNHLVEEALEAAEAGDLAPWLQLLGVVRHPYEVRPGLERFTLPAPADAGPYKTFCGT